MKYTAYFIIVCIALACSPFSTPIVVDFTSAPQLSGGEAVILGGQVIGHAERPRVRSGAVEVVVNLQHDDSLKSDTLFVLDSAPNLGTVLVAIPRGDSMIIDHNAKPHFRGAASRAELAAIVAKENVGKALNWINEAIEGALQGLQK